MTPKIHIAPAATPEMEELVADAGGRVTDAAEADGIVWTDPSDPQGLKDLLARSDAGWVQLPFAGIERFVAAGVLDRERTWTCAKGIYGPSTAEHALALMLMAARRLHHHAAARSWGSAAGLGSGFGAKERMLKGLTVVIVGTGGIGTTLTRMLSPLGPNVIGVNRSGRPLEGAAETVTIDRLDDVLPAADFLVLAAALTDETRGLIDRRRLDLLPEGAWVVNVARGAMIVTDDLVAALKAGRLGGAALDVTEPEPLPDGHPLWELPNAVITPHVANTWDMAVPELIALVKRNVAHLAAGEPLEGLVDVEAGY